MKRATATVLACAIGLALCAAPATAAEELREETIATGGGHACAIGVSGRVLCWGNNFFGQLGRGTSGTPQPAPGLVSGIGDAVAISAGMFHACAVREGGQAVCWGRNNFGQLGDGTTEQRLAPTAVQGLGESAWLSASPSDFTCATQPPGQALCWGNNGSGQLGDGSTEGSLLPVAVLGFEEPGEPEESVPVETPPGPSLSQPAIAFRTVAPPVLGVRATSIPVSGRVLVRRPGSSRYVRLTEPDSIPIGSLVDVRAGRVRIVSADGRGGTREADFYGGIFRLLQAKSAGAPTEARLDGPLSCPRTGEPGKRASASKRSKAGRFVWGSGKGSHRSTGRFSSATVRGTIWLVWDRCDNSTLTKVARGRVEVRDFARRKTVLVRKGQKYVAKPVSR